MDERCGCALLFLLNRIGNMFVWILVISTSPDHNNILKECFGTGSGSVRQSACLPLWAPQFDHENKTVR